MKKLFLMMATAAVAATTLAAEGKNEAEAAQGDGSRAAVWPSVLAVCEWPASYDVTGLRLTIPFSTAQECVTGIDLGLWGRAKDYEGFMLSVLRNDATDTFGGVQAGIYNSANRADLFCVQVGLFNEAQSFCGVQAGIINVTGDGQGFQFGLINRAETLYGFQLGLINVIRDAEMPVLPVFNIGF